MAGSSKLLCFGETPRYSSRRIEQVVPQRLAPPAFLISYIKKGVLRLFKKRKRRLPSYREYLRDMAKNPYSASTVDAYLKPNYGENRSVKIKKEKEGEDNV